MSIKLGINLGFALNRFPAPEEWVPLVADEFGLKIVQFTADLLNPALPEEIVAEQSRKINKLCSKHGVEIRHTFTGAFTRVNHFAHPDPAVRQYWQDWFKKFVDLSVFLGAESLGSHPGIFSVNDHKDPSVRLERFRQVASAWHDLADYARKKGLSYLMWEPMSIPREMGETIAETRRIQKIFLADAALPIKLCLDVDHGDVSSTDPRDVDPYAWLTEFATEVGVIHLKQSSKDKGGHWPFTAQNNDNGRIKADQFIAHLKRIGLTDVTLLLELSFREREPFESRVISDIKASVDYWQAYLAKGWEG